MGIFKWNFCLYPQPPAEGKGGNTSALGVLCQTKGVTDSQYCKGRAGYKIPFAGLNSSLGEDLLCSSAMAGTLAWHQAALQTDVDISRGHTGVQ